MTFRAMSRGNSPDAPDMETASMATAARSLTNTPLPTQTSADWHGMLRILPAAAQALPQIAIRRRELEPWVAVRRMTGVFTTCSETSRNLSSTSTLKTIRRSMEPCAPRRPTCSTGKRRSSGEADTMRRLPCGVARRTVNTTSRMTGAGRSWASASHAAPGWTESKRREDAYQ